ncbi:SDR family oxidoreductase [Oceanibacterium hippocampi]|uniref:3-oxoacyl-[acyl-carrier-protein] reductase FabG n=1 Tax=Oceanibacterium hippocampi TaxID=745714 RepID=A0A1Y5TWX6_9PROT|nr:SDR family oxidoreductase [Oceanibacterium hippocampi]SLN75466.1 3-oxoacyl-[acyl-carrier-protein] reductase FabG [Oceanibacterium hippocampi]
MDLDLAGKTVMITGASKGIGRAAAEAFAREGCDLCLAARSREQLECLRDGIAREQGVKVTIFPMDLSAPSNMIELAAECETADILVNNAGDISSGPLDSLTDDDWRRGFDLKVFGYITLTRELYRHMKARKSGVIVNDIGNSGENWDANYIAGSTGNAALMSFTKALGGASLNDGIRVVGVNPGPVATDRMTKLMKRRAVDWYGDEGRWEELFEKYPGGRPATPEEVADLMVFLASPKAGYISGTIVTIDGGIAARGSII